jgi:spermidine/putrescine transport system permease protein
VTAPEKRHGSEAFPSPARHPLGISTLDVFFGTWTALVMAFLYIPIALLVVFSFNSSRLNVRWEGFSRSSVSCNKNVTAFYN